MAASTGLKEVQIQAESLSSEAFKPFGQVAAAIDDMKSFDQEDAQLNLSNGTPRFYIMRLPQKPQGLSFTSITHHKLVKLRLDVTINICVTRDCEQLEVRGYMAVARAGLEHLKPEDLKIFKVPPGVFIKLNEGTWHAGPHFEGHEFMDFYNLELSDTNQVDHYNHYFDKQDGIRIRIQECE